MSENNEETDDEIKKGNKFSFIILALICIAAIISIVVIVNKTTNLGKEGTNNNNGGYTPKLFTREAHNGDIDAETNNDFTLSISCIIKPHRDISNLQLRFQFADKNKNIITTKTKNVGNVTENVQYTVSFSLTEFGFMELFKISYYQVAVIGGTVSYFA